MSPVEISAEEVGNRVRLKIGQMAPVPPAGISSDLTLQGDLSFDSLQLFELAAELEDELGLPEIDEDDVAGIETVGDVERRVLDLLAQAGGANG